MADNEIKIKVVVDDSQEKKYYSESESRRKKSTAQETEQEKRKTATLKSELDTKYANLTAALARELEAEKQGNRLEIKEAIAKRKILESELRTFEAFNRNSLSRQLADFKAAKQMELVEARKNLSEFRNAPKTKLRGAIGSEAYVSQLIASQKTMQTGSAEFNQTGVLIDRYQTKLKEAGREVKSLSQQIGGELNSSLKSNVSSLLNSTAAYLGLGMAISTVSRFVVDSVKEYMKQETALRTLTFAVEKVSKGNSEYTKSLIDFADETQNLYNINDDVIAQSQAYLVLQGRTEDQIKELVKTAIDLSAVQGDLSDENVIGNIQKLDATYEGVTGKLGKYDSRIKDLTKTQLENGDAVKLLGEKFKGTAEEVNKGTEGAWRKWVVGLSESKEVAGGVIVTLVTLNQTIANLTTEAGKKIQGLVEELIGLRTQTERDYILNFKATGLEELKNDVLNAIDVINSRFKPINTKEEEANSGTKNNSTNSGSKSSGSRTETQKEILNLIELEQQKLAKLNTQLTANLGDIGSELQLRREILAVELEIFRLRTGQRIDLGKALEGRNSIGLTDAGVRQRFIGLNPRAGNDPRGDMSSEELEGVSLTFEQIKSSADATLAPFQNILQLAGLTESEFGKILTMIQSAFSAGNSVFDIISGVLNFIPGGSVIGGAIGAVGGSSINPMAGGMPRSGGMVFRPIIKIDGELSKLGTYKIVSDGNNMIAERGTGVI